MLLLKSLCSYCDFISFSYSGWVWKVKARRHCCKEIRWFDNGTQGRAESNCNNCHCMFLIHFFSHSLQMGLFSIYIINILLFLVLLSFSSPFLPQRRKNWKKHYRKYLGRGKRWSLNRRYVYPSISSCLFMFLIICQTVAVLLLLLLLYQVSIILLQPVENFSNTCQSDFWIWLFQIDPSILGGLVVEFGQKVFDMSIKTRAKQMERFLREPTNV